MRIIQTISTTSKEASGTSYSMRILCESIVEKSEELELETLD